MSKTLDNLFVIVYNCNIRDVPFIAVVDKFWRTVDKEATRSPRIDEVAE